jgi:hypothetical protein
MSISELRLSDNVTINSSDTLLGTVNISGLAAGGAAIATASVTIPTGIAIGTYYIGVIADAGSAVSESSETNNTGSYQVSITKIPGATILLVEDDNQYSFSVDSLLYYTSVLTPGTYDTYRVGSNADGPPSSFMLLYDVVIWFTGDNMGSTLRTVDENNLMTFLDAGNKKLVLVSWQYFRDLTGAVSGSITNTFVNNYLKISSFDTTLKYQASGQNGTVAGGLTLSVSGISPVDYFGYYQFTTTAAPMLKYSSSVVALQNETVGASGNSRVIYFIFPFENIVDGAPPNTKQELMNRMLSNNWSYTAPVITSLNIEVGVVGDQVTITGSNFGAVKGSSYVTFNTAQAAPADYISWSDTSIVVKVPVGATTGSITVTTTSISNGKSFIAWSKTSGATVLLIDDDGGNSYQTKYATALTNNGVVYDTYTVLTTTSNGPPVSVLSLYTAVVWVVGNDLSSTLKATDQTTLATYLGTNGGKLFISGRDLGYDIRNDAGGFYGTYLHATYNADGTGQTMVYGATGNSISGSFASGLAISESNYVDEITPDGSSTAIFSLNSAGGTPKVGLSYSGAYQVVYLSFGFHAIISQADADLLMDKIMSFFGL